MKAKVGTQLVCIIKKVLSGFETDQNTMHKDIAILNEH